MKVENSSFVQSLISKNLTPDAKGLEFEAELERQLMNTLKSYESEKEEEKVDTAVEEFRKNLTSMGAVSFFQQFNMEKIEKKLEEKRAALEAALGLNEGAKPVLEGEARVDALKALNDMMSSYEKELKEQMQAMKEFDEKKENPQNLSSFLASL